MKLTIKQPRIMLLLSQIIIGFLVFGYILFIQLPVLHVTRDTIDNTRANRELTIEQQSNLQVVTADLAQREDELTQLGQEIWKFTAEDDFYKYIDQLSARTNTQVDLQSLADAVPGSQPIERSAIIKISGAVAPIWRAVNDLQSHQPLLAINSLTLTGAGSVITAEILLSTIWI
jgi:hypothetical protein